ncbi:hypothetical protein CWI39_0637p0040 [Hamiltosporidium magnivora]|uniref:WD40 domain-containing protein n=1 Tax=Hamiltosporidium magnivora TaxID=148818 RepID=A0A4Q9LCW5_9MICR|nr:hypothetical protein CWI39_0637p0040 [Hamiltosporidium magnivora]
MNTENILEDFKKRLKKISYSMCKNRLKEENLMKKDVELITDCRNQTIESLKRVSLQSIVNINDRPITTLKIFNDRIYYGTRDGKLCDIGLNDNTNISKHQISEHPISCIVQKEINFLITDFGGNIYSFENFEAKLLKNVESRILNFNFQKECNFFCYNDENASFHILDASKLVNIAKVDTNNSIYNLDLHPDGNLLMVNHMNSDIYDLRCLDVIMRYGKNVMSGAFMKNGFMINIGTKEGVLSCYDIRNIKNVGNILSHKSSILNVTNYDFFTVSYSADNDLNFSSVFMSQIFNKFDFDSNITAFDKSEEYLAIGFTNKTIKIFRFYFLQIYSF